MSISEVFIVLPEIAQEGVERCVYLNTPDASDKTYAEIVHELLYFRKYFSYETYNCYYDVENMVKFTAYFDDCDEYPNNKLLLKEIFKKCENWRESVINDSTYYYNGSPISNDVLSEIATRSKINSENAYVLINHYAISDTRELMEIEDKNQNRFSIYKCKCEIKNIHSWFSSNRKPQRIYNHNPKHGENGCGNWENASPLLCSKGEAEILLHKAIGTMDNDKNLYYYDTTSNKYIKFYSEGNTPNKQYHGHHLSSDKDISVDVMDKKKKCLIKNNISFVL